MLVRNPSSCGVGAAHRPEPGHPAASSAPARGATLLCIAAFAAACGTHHAAAERRRAEAPYRVDEGDPTKLRVRGDLDRRMETARVGESQTRAVLVGYGRLGFAPDAHYAVRVPFSSFVERVRVSVGDVVHRGQPLVDLRSPEVARVRAEYSAAEVAVSLERQNLERLQRLQRDGTATERELAEARARMQSAETQRNGLRASLGAAGAGLGGGDRFTLTAPAEGRVLQRTVDPGERVSPESEEPAFLVGDPDRLVVRAGFPERDAVWLRDGIACRFTASAIGAEVFDGTVVQIVHAVDPRTRTLEATCRPSRQDARLDAEMTARVEVSVTGGSAVVVPRAAVLLRRDESVVFVRVSPGVLERRPVHTGLSVGDQIQVLDGVATGDEVVTRGAVLLDGELDQLL